MFKSLFKNEFGTIRYAEWEWTVMRSLYCVLLWVATSGRLFPIPGDIRDHTDQEKANGLAHVFNLDWMGQPIVEDVLQYVFLALLIIYALGKWQLPVSAALLVLHSAIGGIFSSPAKDHHATQVIGLVLLGQFIWFAWEAIRKRFFPHFSKDKHALDRPTGAIFFSQQLIAAAYVVSAISKWVNSGGGIIPGAKWVEQVPNIVVQLEKNQMQDYYDHLQMSANTALNQNTIDWVINSPWLAMILFGSAFYLELFAFFALWNRAMSLILGLSLIALHLGINATMHLTFPLFESIGLVFFVNLPFWIWRIAKGKNALAA